MEQKRIAECYDSLRNKALVYFPKIKIYEFPEGEDSLQKISMLVAGKVFLLEPNKIINSVMLSPEGKIIDIVYIMMFEDKYRILTSADNPVADEFIKKQCEGSDYKEVTGDYRLIVIEGPYSWKIVKNTIGLEVLGLSYLRFMDATLNGVPVVLSRAGVTGEYGYRIFVRSESFDPALDAIRAYKDIEYTELDDDAALKEIMTTAISEIRFPVFNSLVFANDLPVENELRWMIDFRKQQFNGKEKVEDEIHSFRKRVLAFVCDADIDESQTGSLGGKKIFIEDKEIGVVKRVLYSPALKKYIGYASIDKEWGYVGIKDYIISYDNKKIPIETFSTPLFLTQSNVVQME